MLPFECITEPEQRVGSGECDFYVHNGVEYYIEFCVTEFAKEEIPTTEQAYPIPFFIAFFIFD
jgi:hypothetical protein